MAATVPSPLPRIRIHRLLAADTTSVALPWDSRFNSITLASHLTQYPGLAFWAPGSGEYVVGGYWRGRRDIGLVLESSTGPGRGLLLDRLLTKFRRCRFSLAVLSQDEAESALSWYQGRGWKTLDRLLVYRLVLAQMRPIAGRLLALSQFQPEELDDLTEVDRASFPWLWQQEPLDFLQYAAAQNVRALTGHYGGRIVGYVSYSIRKDRGHLDRLAVHPEYAGQGFGSFLLTAVLTRLKEQGILQIGLTTQEANLSAQRLYRLFGFARTGESHEILGVNLSEVG